MWWTLPLSRALRGVLLAYMALVLGLVAPAHHHVARAGAPAPVAISQAQVLPGDDAADPACALCLWKDQTTLDRGLPAAPLPAFVPALPGGTLLARAPPGAAALPTRSRAPPLLPLRLS